MFPALKSNTCTILGSSVYELPYGMEEEHPDCIALKANMAYKIHSLYLDGITNFLCTCEYGVPMWAAETILTLKPSHPKMALHIMAPFEEQPAKWSESVRDRYFFIHEHAETAKIMRFAYADEAVCRRYTDKHLIDLCNTVLTDSYTLPLISYAKDLNLQIILMNKEFAFQ